MNVNDFLEVTAVWNVNGASNPCLNVWDFRCEVAEDPTELQIVGDEIGVAFIARYVTPLLPYISNQCSLVELRLRSLNDATEFYDLSGSLATGGNGNAMLPAFVTYSISEQRASLAVRRGRKALVGVPYSSLATNGTPSVGIRDAFDVVFDGWQSTAFVTEDPVYQFAPYVVRKSGILGTPPTVYAHVTGYSFTKFGSQNTRK